MAVATPPAAEPAVTRPAEPTVPTSRPAAPAADKERPLLRQAFKYLNRYFMVPAFRLGLGPLIGTPFGGYVMVLKTTGRKSGAVRYAPLNYAILDGAVYCIAGWGEGAHWLANLRAEPRVEVLLPGGAVAGLAEVVSDPAETQRGLVQVARNAGFATLFGGVNPLTAGDEEIAAAMGYAVVVRIRPAGLGNGAWDPGGWGWIPAVLLQVGGLIWLLARLGRRGRKRQAGARHVTE